MNAPTGPVFAGPPPTPAAGRPLFWPVVLIGIGAVALLTNVGLLDWAKVAGFLRLWPLLLIALGLAIVFRDRLPGRLATVVGALVLILLLVAAASAIDAIPGAISGSTAPAVTTRFSAAAAEVVKPRLELSVGAATVNVHSGATGANLYQATISAPGDEKPQVRLDPTTGTLSVTLPGRNGFDWTDRRAARMVDLTLDDQLPWELALSTGATQSTLDLSNLKLTSVSIDSGASSIRLTLPKPSGTIPVNVSGGAMHLTVQRPAGAPIRVNWSGGASSVSVDGQEFGGLFHEGQVFASPGFATATDRFDFSIQGGAGSTTIS
jgi:hypothetical protein